MFNRKRLATVPEIIIWILALLCFFTGLFVAISHIAGITTHYNFAIGPLGDDAYDAARVTYPILTGESSIWHILRPFADHRVVTERLLALFSFIYTNGTNSNLGFIFAFVLSLTSLLLINFIFNIKSLSNNIKILLAGIMINLTFAGISLINYATPLLFSWPQVILYTLLTFFFLQKYCSDETPFNTHNKFYYLMLTSTFAILTIYSFNIGLILWPIIFIVLYKHNVWKLHIKSWLLLSGFSSALYFSRIQTETLHHYWRPNSVGDGIRHFLHEPLTAFSYLSRIVSIPIIPDAQTQASIGTYVIALLIMCASTFFLAYFIRKKRWLYADTILFACLSFSFTAILLISISRFWVAAEYVNIGLRFTTPSLLLWASLIACLFSIISTFENIKILKATKLILSLAASTWLLVYFIPGDQKKIPYMFDLSYTSRYFIALASGVPINEGLLKATYGYNEELSIDHLTYLNNVQQKYKKCAYSLWPSQIINTNINKLSFKTQNPIPSTIVMENDLRHDNPAIYLDVTILKNQMSDETKQWFILITDNDNTVAGFGIRAPNHINFADYLLKKNNNASILWRATLNSDLVKGHQIKFWLASKELQAMHYVGSLEI